MPSLDACHAAAAEKAPHLLIELAPVTRTTPRSVHGSLQSETVPGDRPDVPERASAGHRRSLPGDELDEASYLVTDLAPADGTKTCFALTGPRLLVHRV